MIWESAAAQAEAIRKHKISARELTSAYVERIDRLDGELGSYLHVDREKALASAEHVDQLVARGEDPGALGGVPIALKDIFVTHGTATTCASRMLAGWIPPYDGTAVARLRAAGAVLLGKLNMDEFAMGSSNENSAVKACRNPWDLSRVPGGSSGGSAAAVVAGLCAASLGTDTGGSIRQPAALTGCVGIKPTYGRVSRYGVVAFASSLDQVGPLARSVEDAALLLEVISGHDPLDATSLDRPVPRYRDSLDQGVRGLKIGLPAEYFAAGLDAEIEAAVRNSVAELEKQGASVVPVSLPHSQFAIAAYYLVCTAEASSNLSRYDGVRYGLRVADKGDDLHTLYRRSRGAGFGSEVKRRIMLGTYALRSGYYDAYYKKAQQVRALIRRDFERAFAECDVIASPVTPAPAFPIGEKSADPLAMYLADIYTISCNLAGLPGLSVPCGTTTSGLPIGLQLLGAPLAEATLLRVAAAHERGSDWPTRKPARFV